MHFLLWMVFTMEPYWDIQKQIKMDSVLLCWQVFDLNFSFWKIKAIATTLVQHDIMDWRTIQYERKIWIASHLLQKLLSSTICIIILMESIILFWTNIAEIQIYWFSSMNVFMSVSSIIKCLASSKQASVLEWKLAEESHGLSTWHGRIENCVFCNMLSLLDNLLISLKLYSWKNLRDHISQICQKNNFMCKQRHN